jgi:cardiolipin synthase
MRKEGVIVLAALLLAPATARAQSAASVIGRWRIEGRDQRRGAFAGVIDITKDSRGLRYERTVRFGAGRSELESGSVEALAGKVVTSSEPAVAEGGLAGVGLEAPTALPHIRRSVLASAPGRLEGSYSVVGGAADERGDERLERSFGGSDSFELLVDGNEYFPRLDTALRTAKRSIHVESFAWYGDQQGTHVCDLLAAKAREGVEVRVIPDAIGALPASSVLKRVSEAGGEVVWANRIAPSLGRSLLELGRSILSLFGFSSPHERRGFENRDHRKLVLIDGRYGFTGGMGMTDEYKTWHDVMGRFEGPVVGHVQAEFFDRWHTYGGKKPPRDPASYVDARIGLPPAGDTTLEVVASVPGLRRDGKDTYLREIGRARRRVLIENPYTTDDDVIGALEKKAREGVPVTLIVPNDKATDAWPVKDALAFIEGDIIASGVDLRKYRGRMVHAKVAAIDTTWSTIGSHNIDKLSMEKLSELNLASHDPRVARIFEQRIFEKDIPASDRVVPRKLDFWQRIINGVSHFFRSFL